MVTDEARILSRIAKDAALGEVTIEQRILAQRAADVFFEELFENCAPTEDEFVELVRGVVLTARALWKLPVYVPAWESQY